MIAWGWEGSAGISPKAMIKLSIYSRQILSEFGK
jgi:hypothetical protein